MRYKNRKFILKYVDYNFKWYACSMDDIYIIYINKKLRQPEKQKILHSLLKA